MRIDFTLLSTNYSSYYEWLLAWFFATNSKHLFGYYVHYSDITTIVITDVSGRKNLPILVIKIVLLNTSSNSLT